MVIRVGPSLHRVAKHAMLYGLKAFYGIRRLWVVSTGNSFGRISTILVRKKLHDDWFLELCSLDGIPLVDTHGADIADNFNMSIFAFEETTNLVPTILANESLSSYGRHLDTHEI